MNVKTSDPSISYVSPKLMSSVSGVYNLTSLLRVLGKVEKDFDLIFASEQIEVPEYDAQTGDIISLNSNYEFKLPFRISLNCSIGYELRVSSEGMDICKACTKGRYSIVQNKLCTKCREEFECELNIIKLPSGYWRANLTTDSIMECDAIRSSCIGDIQRENDSTDSTRTSANYYCKEGKHRLHEICINDTY